MNKIQVLMLGIAGALTACSGGGGDGDTKDDPTTFGSSIFVKTVNLESTDECPNGGIRVESGLDVNNNKVLDDEEISETQIVCNGDNGSNGLNNLISVTNEPAGVNCGAGGKKIETGLDENGNSILDNDEIVSTDFVCHGLAGSGGSGNADCIIDTAPDDSTRLVCGDQSIVLVPGNIVVSPTQISPISGGYLITDAWDNSGGRDSLSYRNPHYLFDVDADGDISIDIESNSNNYIYLLDALGVVVGETSADVLTRTVTAGTYTVVAATLTPGVSENFTVQVTGNLSNPRKVDSDFLNRADTWVNSGGRSSDSFRNHHYSFSVERDTYLDILISSSVASSLYLMTAEGIPVSQYVSGGVNGAIRTPVSAGSYQLVAGTHIPGADVNYELDIYGHFIDFAKIPSDMLTFQDAWSNSGGRNVGSFRNDHYVVTVDQATYLDVILESSVAVAMYLVNEQGMTVANYQSGGSNGHFGVPVAAGTYTLVAATHSPGQSAQYTLAFFGHFSSIVKTIPSPVTQLNGSWENSAGRVPDSFRNDHYTFTVDADTYVDVIVGSSVPVALYVLDSLGIEQAAYESGSTTGEIHVALTPDTYRLVVGTISPGQTAQYTLEIHGQYSGFQAVPAQTLSTSGSWISSGGRDPESPDNPKYTVTVTEDSYIDVMIETPANSYLYLLDSIGVPVLQRSGNSMGGQVTAGTYTVVAATNAVGETADFNLTVVGQVENLVSQ